MNDTTIQQFCSAFLAVSGKPHRASTLAQAAALVVQLAAPLAPKPVALANLPEKWMTAIRDACGAAGIDVVAPPWIHDNLPARIDDAGLGVTGMAFAIAETGTLVEITEDDADRLVSALPRTHIGIVAADTLVGAYRDAAGPLRQALGADTKKCTVSFISGPSRTGDIELKLTLGVHGPEVAHAIILESDER
ncbi:MAG: hypothetical protein AMXMBFR84_30700 [Candidatus Hydrogenedentota bacterium]